MSNDGAGAVTDMGDKSQGNAPKLRFPEFVGKHLHDTRLGEVTKECKSRNRGKFAADVVMGVSKEDGIVPMQARLVADDIARYKIVRKDWFAYNPMRLNIGSIARWQGDNVVLVSPDYVVFCCTKIDEEPCLRADYLDHFRRSTHWSAFTGEAGDGGVRVRIYYDDIAKVRLILPDGEEQQKITACLSSLDAVISAETDKLALLRGHKKGLMQQLFPATGETTSRLRFPEFRDDGEWAGKQLSCYIDLVSGLHLSPDEYAEIGDTPYFSGPSDFTNDVSGISKWTNKIANVAVENDILIVVKGSGVGDFWRLSVPRVAIGRQLMAIRVVTGSSEFLYQSMIAQVDRLKSRASGNLIPGLSRPDILELPLLFPPSEAEQEKIAECLSSVDLLIGAAVDVLAALKAHKNGLMQQLFPSSSEAVV